MPRVMIEAGITYKETMNILDCPNCGVVFAITRDLENRRREDKRALYCPNGHQSGFNDETNADRLANELAKERDRGKLLDNALQGEKRRHGVTERQLRAQKGQVTRLKNRAHAGLCPHCNRHFTALQRHIATKHADACNHEGEEA